MKIAIVTNNYKPYSGGVVSSIDSFATNLAAEGHKVFIITLDFTGLGNSYNGNISVIRIFSPIRFVYKTNHIAIPWLPSRAILQILQDINPDVIHSQHPFLLGSSALKAARALDVPVVFTYHSQYEKFAHHVPLPDKITKGVIRTMTSAYCDDVDGIIAPSGSVADLIKNGGCATNVKVIPSGILPIYLKSKFKCKKENSYFNLLTVSRFAKEKEIPFLLKMFAQLDDRFKLTLVGYGAQYQYLRSLAYDDLKFTEERVKFVVRPAKTKIVQLYKQSDAFVFASRAETQGLVLAESMATGTPVVARYGPGQDDLVVDGSNGFLVNSIDEMVDRVQLLASDRELHLKMQRAAFKAGSCYDSLALSRKLVEFYEQVIG